jgi:thioredoxin reductase (NADPH)
MNVIKNSVLLLCLFFLFGCLRFSESKNNFETFDLNTVEMDENTFPVIIFGAGFGGLTAGIYLRQANIPVILIAGERAGGAITSSHSVRNWPGEMDIAGWDLAEKVQKHARANNVPMFYESVIDVVFDVWPYKVITKRLTDGKTIERKALSCIIAMGSTPKFLQVPGEQEYWGKGISNCAVCDGSLYKNKIVAVVGGSEVAVEEALYLSNIAKKVYVFVRSNVLRTQGEMVQEVKEKNNVIFLYNTEVKKIEGDGKQIISVNIFDNVLDKTKQIKIDGLFLAIGSKPNSQIFKGKLELDSDGYVLVNQYQETSKKGIFAVGDIADDEFRQLVTSASAGCKSAFRAQGFLEEIGYEPKTREKKQTKKTLKLQNHVAGQELGWVGFVTNQEEFEQHVLCNERPVVVDFFSPMCLPCKQMLPLFDKLGECFRDDVDFVAIDASKLGNIAQDYQVYFVPTFILFKDGKEVNRMRGTKNFEEFKKIVEDTFGI